YLAYVAAVEEGIIEEKQHYPFDPTSEGKPKRSKAYNLLKRLSRYEDILKFFTERNAEIFCRRGYIASMKKQGLNQFDAFKSLKTLFH
ncbi:MAG: hypothetical protein ACRC6Z_06240, partial [Cetobacterium sp.]